MISERIKRSAANEVCDKCDKSIGLLFDVCRTAVTDLSPLFSSLSAPLNPRLPQIDSPIVALSVANSARLSFPFHAPSLNQHWLLARGVAVRIPCGDNQRIYMQHRAHQVPPCHQHGEGSNNEKERQH